MGLLVTMIYMMLYMDKKIYPQDLLGTFVTTQKKRLSADEESVIRKTMRIIGRENERYAELHL